MNEFKYIVVGGGIAGVTCVETLSLFCKEDGILLITASHLVKAVMNFRQVSKTLEEFEVKEQPITYLEASCPHVNVIQSLVTDIDTEKHEVTTQDDGKFRYKKLCLCNGAKPKIISKDNPYVLGIRDTESVQHFQQRLVQARRIVIVGNGGIATELVYEIEGCQVIWAIKDSSINAAFVDPGAAEFFLPQLTTDKTEEAKPVKRLKYTDCPQEGASMVPSISRVSGDALGGALGPDWVSDLKMRGRMSEESRSRQTHVEYNVEVKQILTRDQFINSGRTVDELTFKAENSQTETQWPVYIELSNSKIYGCDFIISATGVEPNTDICSKNKSFLLAEDGGLKVDDRMSTSVKDVYAAGDVCTASWEAAPHWQQMRLWTQARQMGHYAAKSMVADLRDEELSLDISFELFSHVTRFFNYKVVLLGKFNGQGFGKDYEVLLRVTKGLEFVKVIMKDGKMQGAILIGDTDLEETFENLILNQMDLSAFGEDILDPNIDIEDYFD